MNAERVLAHYERIADAPDAIARLRRFVLDLAVRGKLVQQDPNDEPASELLKRIAQEKARLVKAGEIRKPKTLPAVDEAPFDIPAASRWNRIREVTSDRGQTVPDTRFTYIDVTAIDKEKGIVAEPKVLAAKEAPSRARKITRKGDVIYSCVRPHLLNVAVIEKDFEPAPIASTAFAILDGHGLVLPRYLWIVLRSPFMVECVEAKMRWQAYPAINDTDFALLPVPLPPLAEQHRIVAKVNELMGLCDRLETAQGSRERSRDRLASASLARLHAPDPQTFQADARFALDALSALTTRPDQIRQLRQTILNLAVRGKLVPQDPNDEPASELLARLATTKSKGRKGRDWSQSASSRHVPTFEPPFGWSWTTIDETAHRVTVGYAGPMRDQYVADGVPFLRSQNVRAHKFREEGLIYISPGFHKKIIKSALAPGDVVVVRSENVGTACVIPPTIKEANRSDLVVIQKPECVLAKFLCFYLNSLAATHVEAGSVGVALTHFNTKSVATMPLALPPLAEQHRIVAQVDELMALCDRLEASLAATPATRRRLLDALLAEALAPADARELQAAE
jgi:type I restriction enzyme, S subunit